MKHALRFLAVAAVAAAPVLTASSLSAQTGGRRGGGFNAQPALVLSLQVAVEHSDSLSVTPEQLASITTLKAEVDSVIGPEQKAIDEQLAALRAQAGGGGGGGGGRAAFEGIREQMTALRTAEEPYREKLGAILSEEQVTKLDAMARARMPQRGRRGGRGG